MRVYAIVQRDNNTDSDDESGTDSVKSKGKVSMYSTTALRLRLVSNGILACALKPGQLRRSARSDPPCVHLCSSILFLFCSALLEAARPAPNGPRYVRTMYMGSKTDG